MNRLLSLVLSIIMTLILLTPATGWADTAPATDTAKQFEALRQKGILNGVEDGSAGLSRLMTRAELSTVLVRLLKLTPRNGTPSYEDTGSHWAHEQGYIEAVTDSKLMEGLGDRHFDPNGTVTLEQLAATLVRALNLPSSSDTQLTAKASDWATGLVAAARKAKLLGEYSDYTQAATRDILTMALTAADERLTQAAVLNGPLAIAEFKAVGARKLHVALNQPVETDKITFEIKQGDTLLEGQTIFDKNRTVADIVFLTPLKQGEYTVTLKGAGTEAAMLTATTVVEKERLECIEFATPSNILPKSSQAYIEFNAINQYGEQGTWNAAQFDIQTGRIPFTNANGKQAIKLNVGDLEKDTAVSISIRHSETGTFVQKMFTVGDLPLVSKLEIGDMMFPGTSKKLIAGNSAYLKVKALDQYGYPVIAIDATGLNDRHYGLNTSSGVNVTVKDSAVIMIEDQPWYDYDNDDFPELKLTGGTDADQVRESEITLYALGSGQSVTKSIPLTVIKAPYSLQFGEFNKTVAVGDKNVVLPLIVKDDQGSILTSNEVAEGINQLNVSNTLSSTAEIRLEAQGQNSGLLVITGLKERSGSVTVEIQGTDKKATMPLSIQKERYPAKLMIKTNLPPYFIKDAENDYVILIKDQYGDLIRDASNEYISVLADASDATKVRTNAEYKIHAQFKNIGEVSGNGAFYPTLGPIKNVKDQLQRESSASSDKREEITVDETFNQPSAGNLNGFSIGTLYNAKMTFKGDISKMGTYQITLSLVKVTNQNEITHVEELDKLTKNVEVIDGTDSGITYQVVLDTAVNNTLYAAVDAYGEGIIEDTTVSASAYGLVKDRIKLAKEVILSGKKTGQDVKVPLSWLHSPTGIIASSNPSVASAVYTNTGTAAAPVYKYFVIGDKEGSATLTFIYQTSRSAGTSKIEMKTTSQRPEIVRTTGGKPYAQIEYSKISGKKMWDYSLMGEVSLADQYGGAYKNDIMAAHAKVLGITFYITDIVHKTSSGDDTITVDPSTGALTYTGDGDIASFTLVIQAPNGKKVQTIVSLK
ncbi:S-layer homology domain-containing protein [Paenibacillus sp. RC67]|uniref:S-layer homology domain-containing protein n=1 Tax=Paenibacillus sp. RC67 TaxID=3039392 RepID=UPI0024AD0780|nr:S-layer homology domain-containing protein [Paenibacillus sp. RC67]